MDTSLSQATGDQRRIEISLSRGGSLGIGTSNEAMEQSGKSSPEKEQSMKTAQGKRKGIKESVAMEAKKTIAKAMGDATLDSESVNKGSNDGNK